MEVELHNYGFANFKLVELEPYVRHNDHHVRRFRLHEWCPLAQKWFMMLSPGTWHPSYESEDATPVPDEDIIPSQRLLENLANIPKAIIILREKHGTLHYDASNTEAIGRAALKILRERKDDNWYFEPELNQDEPSHLPKEFDDDLTLKKACEDQWTRYNRAVLSYKEQLDQWNRINLALDQGDYAIATRLLEERDGYEYEGFEIATLQEV